MSTVLHVDQLWKQYRLGVFGHWSLMRDLQSFGARLRGQEDPNAVIDFGINGKEVQKERIWALRDVSFRVKGGEVVGIIGKNGSGKSTLLKIITRITGPTQGQVKIRGRVASLLEVGTGFHHELTGRENIFLNGAILGMTVSEVKQKFDEIVDFSGVEEFIDTPVKRYSSGMYVRLAFAVAAHLESEILLVDEVLAVGDAAFQEKCLAKIGKLASQGRTVLFVSHNLQSLQKLCSRGILLDNGGAVTDGPIQETLQVYGQLRED
jgi:lipopolysaccharide transport system ATP-binding protein